MESQQSQLVINSLSSGYVDTTIVKDVTVSIPTGKFTALIGPNGCGKSTLLKTMARILPAQHGSVLLHDQSVHTMPSKQLAQQLALLPQSPIAPEGLTVKELVSQGRFPHQTLLKQWSQEDFDAVNLAMTVTNTLEFADTPVASLSGGQRQRVWIAMVLAQDTPFLLLDEPTTFLDMQVQVDIMTLLKSACTDLSKTLVVVLHELNMASAFADELIMMKDGAFITNGAPSDVFTAENLKQVFDLDVHIIADPHRGHPVCLPIIA